MFRSLSPLSAMGTDIYGETCQAWWRKGEQKWILTMYVTVIEQHLPVEYLRVGSNVVY